MNRLVTTLLLCTALIASALALQSQVANKNVVNEKKTPTMDLHFLEIVTPDMDGTCAALEKLHGVTFSKPEPMLGNARLADLSGGGRLSVRKPMHEAEQPVTRPYIKVKDLDASFKTATDAGAEVLVPPMPIPNQGRIALFKLGEIEHGLWQP